MQQQLKYGQCSNSLVKFETLQDTIIGSDEIMAQEKKLNTNIIPSTTGDVSVNYAKEELESYCDDKTVSFTGMENAENVKTEYSFDSPDRTETECIDLVSDSEDSDIEIVESGNICHFCGLSFSTKLDVEVHSFSIHGYISETQIKCEICNTSLSTPHKLKIHMQIHSSATSYYCGVCNETFQTSDDFDHHKCEDCSHEGEICQELVISNLENYACEICNRTFAQKRHLLYHRHVHSGRRPHKCKECGRAFKVPSRLSIHKIMNHHKYIKPHECIVCHKGAKLTVHSQNSN